MTGAHPPWLWPCPWPLPQGPLGSRTKNVECGEQLHGDHSQHPLPSPAPTPPSAWLLCAALREPVPMVTLCASRGPT